MSLLFEIPWFAPTIFEPRDTRIAKPWNIDARGSRGVRYAAAAQIGKADGVEESLAAEFSVLRRIVVVYAAESEFIDNARAKRMCVLERNAPSAAFRGVGAFGRNQIKGAALDILQAEKMIESVLDEPILWSPLML